MLKIGSYNDLVVQRKVDFGLYLNSKEEGEVLLPSKYVPKTARVGDTLKVFVYHDSEDRPVATTLAPKAVVGEFAYLTARDVTPIGTFMDWGLEKDLLVPKMEQQDRMREGRGYVVKVCLDDRTGRVYATTRIAGNCEKEAGEELFEGKRVSLLVYSLTKLGIMAVADNRYCGLLYKNETYADLSVGDLREGYISRIRPDGKLDLTLKKPGYTSVFDSGRAIIERLEASGGFVPCHDKSAPEEIKKLFAMSKKEFKRTIGGLYKQGCIEIGKDGIRLKEGADPAALIGGSSPARGGAASEGPLDGRGGKGPNEGGRGKNDGPERSHGPAQERSPEAGRGRERFSPEPRLQGRPAPADTPPENHDGGWNERRPRPKHRPAPKRAVSDKKEALAAERPQSSPQEYVAMGPWRGPEDETPQTPPAVEGRFPEKREGSRPENHGRHRPEGRSGNRSEGRERKGFESRGGNRSEGRERSAFESRGGNRSEGRERGGFESRGGNHSEGRKKNRPDGNRVKNREQDRSGRRGAEDGGTHRRTEGRWGGPDHGSGGRRGNKPYGKESFEKGDASRFRSEEGRGRGGAGEGDARSSERSAPVEDRGGRTIGQGPTISRREAAKYRPRPRKGRSAFGAGGPSGGRGGRGGWGGGDSD